MTSVRYVQDYRLEREGEKWSDPLQPNLYLNVYALRVVGAKETYNKPGRRKEKRWKPCTKFIADAKLVMRDKNEGICTYARYAVFAIGSFYCHDKLRVGERDRENRARGKERGRDGEGGMWCVTNFVCSCVREGGRKRKGRG